MTSWAWAVMGAGAIAGIGILLRVWTRRPSPDLLLQVAQVARLEALLSEKESDLKRLEADLENSRSQIILLQSRNLELERFLATARSEATAAKTAMEESERQFNTVQKNLTEQFKVLSSAALQENSTAFFQLAEQTLKSYQDLAKKELDAKGESIKEVLAPLKESVQTYGDKIARIENERHERDGRLSEQLASLVSLNQTLQKETGNLVHALKRPEVRGTWGEIQLRRVVELAGMSEYCDFTTQDSTSTEEGRYRPDMIVRLPSERTIVVDVKTVLSAYIEATEASDEATRQACLVRHARQLRDQIHLLASKGYSDLYETTPDFVVCFLPGEAFLYAACMADQDLIEYGMKRNVIVATPTVLVALLKAVAYGWRQEEITKNAKVIGKEATELIDRLTVAFEHFQGHGQNLSRAIESYNKFVGSVEHKVMPQTDRILSLGVAPKRELPELETIEKIVREYRPNELPILKN